MAGSIDDADRVFDVMAAPDDHDAWSRDRGARYGGAPIRVGLPRIEELEFFGDNEMRDAHVAFRERLARKSTVVDVSLEPFLAAGSLLYQGPWVAERLVEFGDFLAAQPESIHPVVREILRGGEKYTAVDAFAALQTATGTQGAGGAAVAADGRPRRADDRHHVHRRRSAGRTH
jgi:Asp-tRNA(Asn)/Glu-tRNA(Gln) amidotransferase A subunit family amidase